MKLYILQQKSIQFQIYNFGGKHINKSIKL